MGSDGTLSQTIATTAGQTYTLSFWLQNGARGPERFQGHLERADPAFAHQRAQSGYTHYTYSVTATGSASTLQFSAMNDPSHWDLDNISLTANGRACPLYRPRSRAKRSTISGTAVEGQKLTANVTTNDPNAKISYQWQY